MKKSNFRITLIIMAVLHILFPFVLPYGKLPDLLGGLGEIAGMAGVHYPKFMTGYSAIRFAFANASSGIEYAYLVAVILMLPAVCAIFLLLMMLFGKKRLSYIGYTILSAFMLIAYLVVITINALFIEMGYVPLVFSYVLVFGITIAQFVVGIVGCVKDGGDAAQVNSAAVKQKKEKPRKQAAKVKVPPAEDDIFAARRRALSTEDDIFDAQPGKPEVKKSQGMPVKRTPYAENDIFEDRRRAEPAEDDIFSRGRNMQKTQTEGSMRCISGEHAGIVIQVPAGMATMIGRDPSVCNVVLNGEYVSRRHCSVMYDRESGSYRVTDFSANGVFDENGQRLPSKQVVSLPAGSEINIENNIFRLG